MYIEAFTFRTPARRDSFFTRFTTVSFGLYFGNQGFLISKGKNVILVKRLHYNRGRLDASTGTQADLDGQTNISSKLNAIGLFELQP